MSGLGSSKVSADDRVRAAMKNAGYNHAYKLTATLQGSLWTANNRAVVIKVANKLLHKNSITSSGAAVQENIFKEARILKSLNKKNCSPYIPIYHKVFKSKANYYLVMQHCGASLFEFSRGSHQRIIASELSITEWLEVARAIFRQMVYSVQFMHSKDICHFDVSLENFLINKSQAGAGGKHGSSLADTLEITICDFGLAETFSSDFRSTKYVGKPGYRSPENVANQPFDARSNDIWCLGVCLYMLVLGSAPFGVAATQDLAFNIIMSGKVTSLLQHWHRQDYVDADIVDAFRLFFQYENKRCSMQHLIDHPLMQPSKTLVAADVSLPCEADKADEADGSSAASAADGFVDMKI